MTRRASGDNGIRSVRRALAALDFLVAATPHPVRVTDLAAQLAIAPATASRVLSTLVSEGFASRTPERRFTVGPRSVRLATGWISRLRAATAGPMHRVRESTGETVVVSQLLGTTEIPLAGRPSRDRLSERAAQVAGSALPYPLWATASGRAMLSTLSASRRARLLPPEPYPRLTAGTITDWADLRQLIRAGTRDGVHVEHGEVDPDLWCCAVPLSPGASGEILALSVVCLGEPTPRERAAIHRVLRQEAHNTSVALVGVR